MSLEDNLFKLIENHLKEKYGDQKPTPKQFLEVYKEVNHFYSTFIEETTEFLMREINE